LYLRDLGGGDPYEHDGDDEDEPSAVLETGTHAGAAPSYGVLRTCGAGGAGSSRKASNLTARAASPHACGGLGG
jgi:hypothetical protein